MKIVLAPQAFKGSISALEVANAMADGVRKVIPDAETVAVPVADGGDGTLETLVEALRFDAEDPFIHNDIGVVLHAMGEDEKARESLGRALELAPGPANLLAKSLFDSGSFGSKSSVMKTKYSE